MRFQAFVSAKIARPLLLLLAVLGLAWLTPAPALALLCESNVSSQVQVTTGGFTLNRTTGRFVQSVTIKNISSTPIPGSVAYVLDNLSSNATLFNRSGSTACLPPLGSSYTVLSIGSDNALTSGEQTTVVLEFTNPSKGTISYLKRVVRLVPAPTPTSLLPNPLNITVGASGGLTATLSSPPALAGSLTVGNDNPSVASVPSSVAFAGGQTTVVIPVTAVGEGQAQITVSLNGGSAGSTVNVSRQPATIVSLVPSSGSITQGGTGSLTVTISTAQGSDTTIGLESSDPSIAFVLPSVVVPAGQTQASIAVSGNTPGSATITATLNGTSAFSVMTVTQTLPTVVSLLPPTNPVTLGASTTLTVTISAAQPTDTVVSVSANPTGFVTVPPTVTIPRGQTSTPLVVDAVALGTAMVHVSLNGSIAESAVQVLPPAPAVAALLPNPLTVVVGATGTLTVTLNAAQPTTTNVALTVDNSGGLQVPTSVTVPANQAHVSFAVTGLVVGDVLVSAAVGTGGASAGPPPALVSTAVHIVLPPPTVVSLVPNPLAIQQGTTGTFTLTINAAQLTNTVVPLTNSAPGIIQAPSSVTVPIGQTSVTFPVTALLPGGSTVAAALNASNVSATVNVTPPPTVVTGLTTVPPAPPGTTVTVPKGTPARLHVTVAPASTEPQIVSLSSNNTAVATVPITVPIPAGALGVDFPVLSLGEGSATITASLNGGTASVQVGVTPAALVTLTLSPLTPSDVIGQTEPFTATGTFTDGTTQDLTTSVTWTSSNQAVATINASGVASAVAAGTTTIMAASGSISASTTMTVLTPPALSLAPATATLNVGGTRTLTVTSAAPAGLGGLTVTLSQSGTGGVSLPASVLIPAGQSSATFTATGTAAGTVTVTATAPIRLPATSTLTVTPGVPTITSFNPTSGPVGTLVTITGQNFNSVPANNQVKFGNAMAIVGTATSTTITTTVPQGATTGLITVTTPTGTATSGAPFTVTPRADFTVTATPPGVPTLPGSSVAYSVTLVPQGTFSQLAALSVTNLPPGATAVFVPPYIGPNGSSLLMITTTAATPVGTRALEVQATATSEGAAVSRTAAVSLSVQASGQTVLVGQVLDDEERPLAGVSIKLGGSTLTTLGVTDAAGNFFIPNMPTGQRVLLVDGSTANTAEFTYPTVPMTVTIQSGVVNTLGFIPYLHPMPTSKLKPITPGQTTVLTDPEIPGFKMTIPAGVQIIGWDGQPNTQVGVTVTPVDRSPLPPIPPGQASRVIYLFSFGKLGGGTPTGNVPVDTPNDVGGLPGDKIDLYYFNEAPDGTAPNQWEKYGTGTVSSDGATIITDINPATGQQYGMPRFCCGARRNVPPAPPVTGPSSGPSGSGQPAGEPVDVATGFFSVEKTDLVLPGLVPLQVNRTYRANLTGVGPFGVGTSSSYDIFLLPPPNGSSDALVLYTPGNHQDLFSRQPDGTFITAASPSMQGAIVTTSGSTRVLAYRDKSRWTFNTSNGLLISQTDRNGNTVTITRDGQNRVTQLTEPTGRKLTVSYSGGTPRVSTIQDSLGRTVSYNYDGSGRLTSVTDPAGGVTQYTYDAANRMLTIKDARGITFLTNVYDSNGRVIQQTQADGGVFTFAYSVAGTFVTSTTVTDPRGNATTYRFNGSSFPLRVTDALGQPTTFTRTLATNQLAATTDVLGRATRFTYDANGNTTSIKDAQSQFTLFEYDLAINRLLTLTDALTQTTTFTYDTKGNLKTTTDPLTHATSIAYNGVGQPTSVTDALGNITTFEYDAAGNLTATTDPLGNRTIRTYDAVSRLIALTDSRGFTTSFSYDALNRVTQITDANGGTTSFTYDANGNLKTVTDPRGKATTYTYDTMDRLLTRTDALGRIERYAYDKAGNLITFTDRKSQIATFTYDALNRRIGAAFADGSTTSFVYDAVGRLISALDSVVGRIDFVYDNLDRLVQEITSQGSITYSYDAIGRRTTMTASGQQPVSYGYDAASRLVQVQQGSKTVGLGYDVAGRRTGLTYPNGTSTAYSYDQASRLLNILHQGPSVVIDSVAYAYDTAGNRVSTTRANAPDKPLPTDVQAAYDAANEQTQFNTATQTYDQNGNLTNDGTNTYTWDARNRLIGISGGISASFVYDALGRRISKTINGGTTQYVYDGNDIVQEIGGGAVGATYLRSLNIDEPFVRQGIATEYYHADGLGSAVALTDGVGVPQTTYRYEPFGNTTLAGAASGNSLEYTGRENDGTGLYYYRARYYSPRLQRFVSEDPFSGFQIVPETFNRYPYVLNDPMFFRDPSGLSPAVVAGAGIGAIIGGVTTATGLIAQGITPLSDPGTFFTATAIGTALGGLQGVVLGAGVVSPPLIGAFTGLINNVAAQYFGGRKPINFGSALGATIGGGTGAAFRAAAQAGLAGATNIAGAQLPATVTNAFGSALGTAGAVAFPSVLSTIGSQISWP